MGFIVTRTSEQDFIPATPGTWLRGPRAELDLANEKAAHAVMALLLGLDVHSVQIDRPDADIVGNCDVPVADGKLAQHSPGAVLAGPLASGRWDLVPASGSRCRR